MEVESIVGTIEERSVRGKKKNIHSKFIFFRNEFNFPFRKFLYSLSTRSSKSFKFSLVARHQIRFAAKWRRKFRGRRFAIRSH